MPIDYSDPSQGTTAIAMVKKPATGAKRGTLFINPGGPGVSGIDYLEGFLIRPPLAAAYDIIGFDPRGVGRSDPVDCDLAALDALIAADPDPDTPDEAQHVKDLTREAGESCVRTNPRLVAHVTTVEVAKDLDVLRALVGDDTLNYFGGSYGTYLGATYAALFPARVGRMVLDGAVDPTSTAAELALGWTASLERAFDAFAEDCFAHPPCLLGTSRAELARSMADLWGRLDAQPLPTNDDKRPLTEGLGYYGIIAPLYNSSFWPDMIRNLQLAFDGYGTALLEWADWLLGRTGHGYENASLPISCLDSLLRPAGTPVEDQFVREAPLFGRIGYWSAALGCDGWPVTPTVSAPNYSAPGAAPILVVGTTGDPVTPYASAEKLAQLLESGVLLTRDGEGHTAYSQGNSCIDDAITNYLVEGVVPIDGTKCVDAPLSTTDAPTTTG